MNLNVEKLIETCNQGIEIAQRRQIEWDENVDKAEAAWEQAWRERGVEKWRPLRDKITKALRTGAPILTDDLMVNTNEWDAGTKLEKLCYRPFNRGRVKDNYEKSWTADHQYGRRPVLKIVGFEALIAFLGAVSDKTISTAQLEKAGFRNMSKLFEAAANGVWE